jgi:hypothetical protein
MSDFYTELGDLTIEPSQEVGQDEKAESPERAPVPDIAESLDECTAEAVETEASVEATAPPTFEEAALTHHTVTYPSLVEVEVSSVEASAPPAFYKDLSATCFEASAPPMVHDEAVEAGCEDQVAEEAEETRLVIQPFTESQVWKLLEPFFFS